MVIDKLPVPERSKFDFQENMIEGDETIPNRPGAKRQTLYCPRCKAEYRAGELFCPACDYVLSAGGKTRQVKAPIPSAPSKRVGEAFLEGSKTIVLEVQNQALALPVLERLVIGRAAPGSDTKPDVDLTPFDGLAQGVSRQHLSFERERDLIYIIDQNSLNGTFLNGHRLIPHQKRVLRSGDELQLGYLGVKVRFE